MSQNCTDWSLKVRDACWARELEAIETGTKLKVNGHRVEPYLEPFNCLRVKTRKLVLHLNNAKYL